jgi:23S rRNA (uracil1939-C5)-methyltransferase
LYQNGDQITIEPQELVAGGDALARIDGFPIFASNVYPGDVARVRLVEVKKGFARAELVRIERPSPLRRAAPCPVAEECGGCDWTALRLDAQVTAKRRILTESLRRIGKIFEIPEITLHVSPLNYRLRSRLHEENGAVGFYAMRSNRVVPLAQECEVVGTTTAQHPIPGETWEIDGRLVAPASPPAGTAASSPPELSLLGYKLSTDAFFQVNRHLLETMLRRVTEIAGSGKLAIDLYAGVGFFTRPLTRTFENVIAVEGSPVSVRYLRENTTAEAVHAPVEQWVARMPEADFIFLDPPRAGARREVIDAIGKNAGRICYLSCDPVTFARDANRLRAAGWRLATLDLLDLFPNTHHVETLSSFERAS